MWSEVLVVITFMPALLIRLGFLYATAPETASYYLAWDDISVGLRTSSIFL